MGLSALVDDSASSLPPAAGERPIDLVHLARMTLGDRSLEREVLALFDRQAGMLLVRMQQAARTGICAAAHTLKGSARGIGAWRVPPRRSRLRREAPPSANSKRRSRGSTPPLPRPAR